MFDMSELKERMNSILTTELDSTVLTFEKNVADSESLDEVAMKRVVRHGKIVRKVKVKRKGFKVIRQGNSVKFVRLTQKEKRTRRKSARKAWKVGRGSRKNKTKRTMIRSKVRMRSLYGK